MLENISEDFVFGYIFYTNLYLQGFDKIAWYERQFYQKQR